MLNNISMFASMIPTSIPIATGNKGDQQELRAVGTGTAIIQLANGAVLRLRDALYVPNLACNFLLLAQLIHRSATIHPTNNGFAVILDKQTTVEVDTTNLIFEMIGVCLAVHQPVAHLTTRV
jgi:hypothetical protein